MSSSRKEIAYEHLYNSIITNRLNPGQPISEQEISDELGTSRTPVREALKQLEAEGLVRHIPNRGVFVSEITTQDVEEIFSLREMMEVLALQFSYKKITDKELHELEALLLPLDENYSSEDYFKADRMLHDLIVQYGNNRRLSNFLHNINAQIERIRIISSLTPQRLTKSREEHLEIIRALKEKDLSKSEKALRNHIRKVKESTIEVCKGQWHYN